MPHGESDAHGIELAVVNLCRRTPSIRGKTTIAWKLQGLAKRHGQSAGRWSGALRDGTVLQLPLQSDMTWQIAIDGKYDGHVIDALRRFIQPDSIVLDVGASLGIWTVQLAKLARESGALVHAFEPNPSNIPWLTRNLRLNGLEDVVTVHPVGLGDEAGRFSLEAFEGGVGNGAIVAGDTGGTGIAIEVIRLDDVAFDRKISLIKLDVEGFEPAVIRGGAASLRRDQPVVFGEFNQTWMKQRREDTATLLRELPYEASRLVASRSRIWRPADTVRFAKASASDEDLLLLPRRPT